MKNLLAGMLILIGAPFLAVILYKDNIVLSTNDINDNFEYYKNKVN